MSNFKRIAVSGVGFFSDAYDLFIINIVMLILSRDFHMTDANKATVSAAALWGAVSGQLIFGTVADKIGRKKGFVVTLSMVIIGSILSACSFESGSSSVFVSLCIFRTFLGIGIGGEYPLSATITAESSKQEHRGRLTALVFSMQGVGSLTASIVGWALIQGLTDPSAPENSTDNHHALNIAWRLCLGLGAVPGLITLYFRVTMLETDKFVAMKKVEHKGTVWERTKSHMIHTYQHIAPHWKSLIGNAGSWFLFDIVFYANGLFSSTILSIFDVGGGDKDSIDYLREVAKFNIYLALISLPGYWVGVFLIERPFFGRRNTQIIGFILLGITYIVIGAAYHKLTGIPGLFIALYGLTFFWSNCGPNTTTFVLPSESFPTEARATCHGLSAAAGKVGAVIGASMMAPILASRGVAAVLFICGGISMLGAILTVFYVKETRGKNLDELSIPMSSIALEKSEESLSEISVSSSEPTAVLP